MPYLKVDTNAAIPAERAGEVVKRLSAALAAGTGKPESYCQAALCGGAAMVFGGTERPSAHVEVKGIGMPEERAAAVSKAVCDVLERELGIPGARVYLTFASFSGSMWGVDGRTF